MGIKGLTQLLKKHTPNSYEHTKLYTLSGKKVAIDASLFIYKSLMTYRKNNDFIKNKDGNNISHILGILNKTTSYLSNNITPIYIFDGTPPIEKADVINNRKTKANEALEKVKSGNDVIDIEKYNKQSIRLTSDIVNDVKNLLNFLGVSHITCDGEAEGYASELCRIGYVDYVITEDMDSLPFGATKLVRNCIDKSLKSTESITVFDLNSILNNLNITHDQFVELCILCGCDYCSNIPRIGSMSAYKIIKKYGTIKNYLDTVNPKNVPEDYIERYMKSKELFNVFRDKLDINNLDIISKNVNISELMKYLNEYCDLSDTNVHKYISKIQNNKCIL